jgi:hypothetical protein
LIFGIALIAMISALAQDSPGAYRNRIIIAKVPEGRQVIAGVVRPWNEGSHKQESCKDEGYPSKAGRKSEVGNWKSE